MDTQPVAAKPLRMVEIGEPAERPDGHWSFKASVEDGSTVEITAPTRDALLPTHRLHVGLMTGELVLCRSETSPTGWVPVERSFLDRFPEAAEKLGV
jgi:hypothetical protein